MTTPRTTPPTKDWRPDHYLQYTDERSRPMADLLARVPGEVRTVLDLGCGPGHLARTVRARWPEAELTGVDASPAMIERARQEDPDPRSTYVHADLREYAPPAPVDLVLSNATYQWVPDHLELLPRLADQVAPGGSFAFSVPGNHDAPSHRILRELAAQERYAPYARATERVVVHDAVTYLAALARPGWVVDAWETTYLHVLPGADPVFDWISSTGARPFLAALPDDLRASFEAEYRAALRDAYPREAFGTVLPFLREFVVATRTS